MTAVGHMIHGLLATLLLVITTLQAWQLTGKAEPRGLQAIRGMPAKLYLSPETAVVIAFVVTWLLGAFMNPAHDAQAVETMQRGRMTALLNLFEVKRHLGALGLGILPAYWFFWRHSQDGEHGVSRHMLTLMLAVVVWSAFLIGMAIIVEVKL